MYYIYQFDYFYQPSQDCFNMFLKVSVYIMKTKILEG